MKSSELQNELKHIYMKINSCSWCCQHQVGPAHHRLVQTPVLPGFYRQVVFKDRLGHNCAHKHALTLRSHFWINLEMTRSFWMVFNSLWPPSHGSHQVPGFLAKLEQQTLGKTPAKLNFKQLWFSWAMRLVELPTSLLGLGSESVKGTTANTSNPLFSPFEAVKTHRSIRGGKDPFSFTSCPRLPEARFLFGRAPVMLRCQEK